MMAQSKFSRSLSILIKRSLSTTLKSHPISPAQQTAMAERCILVDEHDRRIGSASKYDCHKLKPDGSLLLHRGFSVFLFNENGDQLLQKRADTKVTFPSCFTNACCSHPIEDFPEELDEKDARGVKLAAIRRLNHELGIPVDDVKLSDIKYLTRMTYKLTDDSEWGEEELDYILILQKNLRVMPNPEEVSQIALVRKSDFPTFIRTQRDPLSPWFRRMMEKSYISLWWNNLSNLEKLVDHKNEVEGYLTWGDIRRTILDDLHNIRIVTGWFLPKDIKLVSSTQ